MWKEQVKNVQAKEWAQGDIDYLIPARHLCHFVIVADYYTQSKSPEQYDWSCLFGGDWEEMTAFSGTRSIKRVRILNLGV